MIRGFERKGMHRLVDRRIMAAVIGDYRSHLEPEKSRRDTNISRPREWDREKELARAQDLSLRNWVKVESNPFPDLDLTSRLTPSSLDAAKAVEEELVPVQEPISPVDLYRAGAGWISPSGKCFSFRSGPHESWVRETLPQLSEHDTNKEGIYDTEETKTWPLKAHLQSQGWVAFRELFMVLRDGNTHFRARPEDLTPAQIEVFRDMYFNLDKRNKEMFLRYNHSLKDLVDQ